MLSTLLNIVLPVFVVAALGFVFGRRYAKDPDMSFVNEANVLLFCPALVLSAMIRHPVDLVQAWPLALGGVLIVILPGLLLSLVCPVLKIPCAAFVVPGMFRNTGNIGIPLLILAYGSDLLGDIIVLFVLSNLLCFSLGLILLSRGAGRWRWLRNPNIWAAVLGVALASHRDWLPTYVLTSLELLGQLAIPLMLFGLGVRVSQDRISQFGQALLINAAYLLAGALTAVLVLWLLPLTPEWARLALLSVMLPPAVVNYILCEQYQVEPRLVASVVLLGNMMSVATIPFVVWASFAWIP